MKPRTFKTLEAAMAWMLAHGGMRHLVVLHDDGCLHGRGSACTCSPEFVVEDLTVETLRRGAREQERWLSRQERN